MAKIAACGSAGLKQSVHVMHRSRQSREDLSWTLKEIVAAGMKKSVSRARCMDKAAAFKFAVSGRTIQVPANNKEAQYG